MIATVDFKPSDVNLCGSFPPLVATYGRTDLEVTAAVIVRVLSEMGNTWRALEWSDVITVLTADLAEEHPSPRARLMRDIVRNPFLRIAPAYLVEKGFAEWVDEPGAAVAFTADGLERLRRWAPSAPKGVGDAA